MCHTGHASRPLLHIIRPKRVRSVEHTAQILKFPGRHMLPSFRSSWWSIVQLQGDLALRTLILQSEETVVVQKGVRLGLSAEHGLCFDWEYNKEQVS